MTLQKKIDGQPLTGEGRPRHLDSDAQGEFPVPEQGEHDLEPPTLESTIGRGNEPNG